MTAARRAPQAVRLRIADAAKADIEDLLAWSEQRFGVVTRQRQPRELRLGQQALEVGVEAHQMFALVNHRCGQPRIGKVMGRQRLVGTQLAKGRPLGSQRGLLHARCAQQRVDKAQRFRQGRGLHEDFRVRYPPQEAAEHYAEIRADLKKKGAMIGANDLLIAAHARSISAVIVTNNTKDFARVKGLKIENWLS